MCSRWTDFVNFLADMGEKPDGKTLDREDNDGDYEPGNCRWVSRKVQARNRRSTKLDENKVRVIRERLNGGVLPRLLADEFGVSVGMIRKIKHHRAWV